jgi:hypothetical protein
MGPASVGMGMGDAELRTQEHTHCSGYERILGLASWEELENLLGRVLSGKCFFGKMVVVAIDGKVLRGTLDENQDGWLCWLPICPEKALYLWK